MTASPVYVLIVESNLVGELPACRNAHRENPSRDQRVSASARHQTARFATRIEIPDSEYRKPAKVLRTIRIRNNSCHEPDAYLQPRCQALPNQLCSQTESQLPCFHFTSYHVPLRAQPMRDGSIWCTLSVRTVLTSSR